jgi:hypothetical protein
MSAYSDAIIAALSPTAIWPTSEASGNLTDATGNGWTFTASGTPTYQASGPTVNGESLFAVQTDGAAFFTTSTSFPGPSASTGRTEAVWVFLPSTSSAAADIFARSATNQNEFRIRHASNGQAIAPHFQADGATAIGNPSGADIDGDVWHLVIGWWDPADDDVYIQVGDTAAVSAAGTTDIKTDSTVALAIMAIASGGSPLRSGSRVSHPMVFERVLTVEERSKLVTGLFSVAGLIVDQTSFPKHKLVTA